jgi:chorismate mutase
LPIICDPSHICGRTDILASVAQKALDLNMVGLMIESHIHPALALSDAQQQITPSQLGELLASLSVRKVCSDNKAFTDQLESLRLMIDEIDEQMIRTLSRRMEIVEQIGEYKRDHNVTVFQLERWLAILRTRIATGVLHGLDETFVKELCELLHKESIRKQTGMMEIKETKFL